MGKQLTKAIIFDAGTLITLSMNGLTGELRRLRDIFDGSFLITEQVKAEVIDKPLTIKNFELEALKTKKLLDENVLELAEYFDVSNEKIEKKAREIMDRANSLFRGQRDEIKILHLGEASCLALSKILSEKGIESVIAIDERTTRMLVEKPENLKNLLERKLHTKILRVKKDFDYFSDFRIIRSAELMYVAWKKGLVEIKDGITILDALLYATKAKGCAISQDEIEEIKRIK